MKARDVVGRRIVSVRQVRTQLTSGKWCTVVTALTLDNGARLVLHAYETEESPVPDMTCVKENKQRKEVTWCK